MQIKVNLTEDIINQCLSVHYHDQPTGRRMKQRLILIPLVLVSISAYLIVTELQKGGEVGQNFYMALMYISFALIYYFFMKNRMMRAGGKLLKSLGENANFEMEVDEGKLVTITPNSTFTSKWEDFTCALISKDNVLLYQANNSFSMFHHTFFFHGEFEVFKNWARNKVQPVLEV